MGYPVQHPASPAPFFATLGLSRGKLLAGIGAALAWILFLGCGDVYRPVANPVLKPGGDPAPTYVALVVSNNGGAPGVATSIDVSGDTNIGNFPVGRGASFAAYNFGSVTALVANTADDTLSLVNSTNLNSVVSTITLPQGSAPVYLGTTQVGYTFVANSGSNTIGAISLSLLTQQYTIPVGRKPVALAETPDATMLYSVNQGDNSVSAISLGSVSDAKVVATIPVGSSPVAVAMNSDGKTLYVANQGSGSISAINVASNTVTATVATGGSPRFLIFDSGRRRLYVANTGSDTISIFDADTGLNLLATVGVGTAPTSIAPLADGTRVYVANSGCADPVNLSGCAGNTVTVIDAVSFAVRKTITVGSTPISLASDRGSLRVEVANRDSNNISSIRTSDDAVVATNASGAAQPVYVALQR